MPRRVSAKRYAQAIFALALEAGQPDQWATDLQVVVEVLQEEDFTALLKHADVPQSAKAQTVDTVLQEIHPLVRNLVHLLVNKGLLDLVVEVQQAYADLLDDHRGRQRVEVKSAVPLDDGELERITQFVSSLIQKEVVVSTQVDESILGGIVVQIGDRLLDGSTRARLDALRQRLYSQA